MGHMGILLCVILRAERMTNEESDTVVRMKQEHTDAMGQPVLKLLAQQQDVLRPQPSERESMTKQSKKRVAGLHTGSYSALYKSLELHLISLYLPSISTFFKAVLSNSSIGCLKVCQSFSLDWLLFHSHSVQFLYLTFPRVTCVFFLKIY